MMKVMIAGIGGASLGTELMKCLTMAGGYSIFGCDISPTAFGLYQPEFDGTFLVDRDRYLEEVIQACHEVNAAWIVPGAEKTTVILGEAKEELARNGITFVANSPAVVRDFSDKARCFEILHEKGIPVPRTAVINSQDDIKNIGLPCIVKPSTDSGGSAMVFFATDSEEAMVYADYITRMGIVPIVQEYIDVEEGEFTIGVLSWPDQTIASSVALRRSLDAKLSVMMNNRGGVISSGYSQGFIGSFPDLCRQAENIAKAIGSVGPINVQGRVKDGVLVPFEINPRFSASSYLRALAGVNELDLYLRHLSTGIKKAEIDLREGWYLRTLAEAYIPDNGLLK